jgi:homoserine kinase
MRQAPSPLPEEGARLATVRAFAPASIGNFAAGFDLLGAALEPLDGSPWGDVVTIAPAPAESTSTRLTVGGPYAASLPAAARRNLVLATYRLWGGRLRERGQEPPPAALHLEKNLPSSSGLGSSASSIAATLAACQAAFGAPLDRDELFALAGRAEALGAGAPHLDNVVPALLGGLQLLLPGAGGTPEPRALPWSDDLILAVLLPELALSTAESRRALPRELPLAQAVGFGQNLAGFVYALERGDREMLRRCLRDVLAEPHRAPLVPGFRAAQAAARAAGALGCTLSGSGPSLFAVAEGSAAAAAAGEAMREAFAGSGVASQVRLCRLAAQGARVLP